MKKFLPAFLLVIHLSGCHAVERKKITTTDWYQATQQATQQYQVLADKSLAPAFAQASVEYPPKKISLLGFKQEQRLELWARDHHDQWRWIKNYPFTANSGSLGPKLKSRDHQIPEGIYKITGLNPFSSWHLSMKINYPNAFDRAQAKRERRTNLGGDIFIHGNKLSVGCIALGDRAISELFVLVSKIGKKSVDVIIAPNDLRKHPAKTNLAKAPKWTAELYQSLQQRLAAFA